MTDTKICSKCSLEKDIKQFSYYNVCNSCRSLASQNWNQENPDRATELRKEYEERNKERRRQRNKEWRLANPERLRQYWKTNRQRHKEKQRAYNKEYRKLRRITNYGLTQEDYERQLELQNHKCEICNEVFIKTPSIDHDHNCCSGDKTCGKCFRGLLCNPCNSALGLLKESQEIFNSALLYLNKHKNNRQQAVQAQTL